jgi:hypothetical protein
MRFMNLAAERTAMTWKIGSLLNSRLYTTQELIVDSSGKLMPLVRIRILQNVASAVLLLLFARLFRLFGCCRQHEIT